MTHSLVMNYGLYKKMEIFVSPAVFLLPLSSLTVRPFTSIQRAKPATRKEMAQFHTDEYVDFLSRVSPDLVEAAAENGASGSGRGAGVGREMGKCEFFPLPV